MKRVITALCFISLINAADDKKEIELKLAGKIYRGYTLGKHESEEVSFIGIRCWVITRRKWEQTIATTRPVVVAQNRKNPEHYEIYKIPSSDNSTGLYGVFNGSEAGYCIFKNFDPNKPCEYTCKALTLLQLYTSTHAKRTLSIEEISVLKDKEPKE